jgi:Domain of unknown function (DUF222)/HNH endonuclease
MTTNGAEPTGSEPEATGSEFQPTGSEPEPTGSEPEPTGKGSEVPGTVAVWADAADLDGFGRKPLSTEELARQEEALAAYIAATAGDQAPDEDAAVWTSLDSPPPLDVDSWLGQLADDQPEEEPAARATTVHPPSVLAVDWDDVADHDGSGPGGLGFESGSVLDHLEPGPVLAAALEDTMSAGLDGLSDDALAGVMLAFRRLESRGAAGLWAAAAELARRRDAAPDPRVGDHIHNETGMLLAWTRPAAQRLLSTGVSLARLPATSEALWAGRIDRLKAELIAYETGALDAELAAAVELLVIDDAPRLTTGQLRARLRRAVLAADPDAVRRRVAAAARDARVEMYGEVSGGTAALCGRDLPTRGALAADQRIDAAARELKAAGVDATLPQLRAAVFLGLLTGSDPRTFLPPSPDDQTVADPGPGTASPPPTDATSNPGAAGGAWLGPGPVTLRGSVNLTMPLASWLGQSFSPGDIAGFGPATAETCQDIADWISENPGSRWCVTLTDKTGRAVGHGCARRPPPARGDPAGLAAWLARLKIEPIEAGTCTHAREVPGYRIPARLHHIVKVRQRTCINPICRRQATKCDDDHTVPYDQGGRTCECDLGPACRTCHRTKQTPGWLLKQPSPGVFEWRLPNGRSVTSTPDPYPV